MCTTPLCNLLSPMNLNQTDPTGLPDNTVEFNRITFDSIGKIISVAPWPTITFKGPYSKDEVCGRTLAHEMGHGVKLGHCDNLTCIMCEHVQDLDLHGFGEIGGCEHSPGGLHDIRAHGSDTIGIWNQRHP